MFPASIPSDPLTLLAALFTLFGLPLIIFSLVLFYAGYIRHDADQALAELEGELDEQDVDREATDAARDSGEGQDSEPHEDDVAPPPHESENEPASIQAPADDGDEPRDAGEHTEVNDESNT